MKRKIRSCCGFLERYGGRNDKRLDEFALDLYYLSRSMPEGLEWLKNE